MDGTAYNDMIRQLTVVENTPTLETARLILRRAEEGDMEAMHALLSDEDVNTFLPWFPSKTMADTREYVQRVFFDQYELPCAYRYAVCLRENNTPIGYVNLFLGGSNDLGYAFRKEYHGQGIASEAASAVVARLRETGLPFITATHDRQNPASGGVMRHIGMTYRYTYEEMWMPKEIPVFFRMYQLNLDGCTDRVYHAYWEKYENHFVEEGV